MNEIMKIQCLSAGFIETNDEIHPLKYELADDYDKDIVAHPPTVFFSLMNGKGAFCFCSGLCSEFVWLNTDDPTVAIGWGKTISHIEPNF